MPVPAAGEQAVAIFAFVFGPLVVAATILVDRYTARPRWQVPRTFRGKTAVVLRKWFLQDVEGSQRPDMT